ncbi:unnamed protein product [Cercopithifilaria johnstoni]|uniref:Uncharacterized protein n=1 Tax=Cercopithifilaria johnstoni TaxID=2874296 RepID=A0A8J2MA89_9BILA|nr:unnamed protein product [Cercopithifilaria johnstoni]
MNFRLNCAVITLKSEESVSLKAVSVRGTFITSDVARGWDVAVCGRRGQILGSNRHSAKGGGRGNTKSLNK